MMRDEHRPLAGATFLGETSEYETTLLSRVDRAWRGAKFSNIILIVLAAILIIPGVQSAHAIRKTEVSVVRADGIRRATALGRWMADVEALTRVAAAASVADAGPKNNPYGYGHWFPTPTFVLMCLVPLWKMGVVAAAAVWAALKIIGIAVVLWLLLRSVGPVVAPASLQAGSPHHKFVVPSGVLVMTLAFSVRALVSDLQHANVNIFVFIWLGLTWWAYVHRRDGWAGIFLSLAIVTKVTPALALIYFAYKRAWKVCVFAAIGLVIFVLIVPGAYIGFAKNVDLLGDWFNMLVRPFALEGWAELSIPNQSLWGVVLRILSNAGVLPVEHMSWTQAEKVGQKNMARPETTTGRMLRPLISLSVVAMLAWACRRRMSDRRDVRGALEFALILLAMMLLSERTWKHHATTLPIVYLAIWYALTHLHWGQVRRGVFVCLLAAQWFMLVASSEGLFGDHIADKMMDGGIFCWGLVLAAIQIVVMLAILNRRAGELEQSRSDCRNCSRYGNLTRKPD